MVEEVNVLENKTENYLGGFILGAWILCTVPYLSIKYFFSIFCHGHDHGTKGAKNETFTVAVY